MITNRSFDSDTTRTWTLNEDHSFLGTVSKHWMFLALITVISLAVYMCVHHL
jgi:hypothetical protein